jgi:hypothetical protein
MSRPTISTADLDNLHTRIIFAIVAGIAHVGSDTGRSRNTVG